jgi:hypothetical protein
VEDAIKIHIDNESMEKMLDVKSTLKLLKQNFLKVIGNDIVDLALAGKVVETKWILEKSFTAKNNY